MNRVLLLLLAAGWLVPLLTLLSARAVTSNWFQARAIKPVDAPDATTNQLDETISAFAQLGVKVMITELDVDMVPATQHNHAADIALNSQPVAGGNDFTNGLPAQQEALAQRYAEFFSVCCQHRADISRVTFWGVTDGDSWLNSPGRVNYPLLFDRAGQPKPAFTRLIELR